MEILMRYKINEKHRKKLNFEIKIYKNLHDRHQSSIHSID